MALASNNEQTYAIFLYNTLMWTTGTAEGGDSGTGLGGIEAEVSSKVQIVMQSVL